MRCGSNAAQRLTSDSRSVKPFTGDADKPSSGTWATADPINDNDGVLTTAGHEQRIAQVHPFPAVNFVYNCYTKQSDRT